MHWSDQADLLMGTFQAMLRPAPCTPGFKVWQLEELEEQQQPKLLEVLLELGCTWLPGGEGRMERMRKGERTSAGRRWMSKACGVSLP